MLVLYTAVCLRVEWQQPILRFEPGCPSAVEKSAAPGELGRSGKLEQLERAQWYVSCSPPDYLTQVLHAIATRYATHQPYTYSGIVLVRRKLVPCLQS